MPEGKNGPEVKFGDPLKPKKHQRVISTKEISPISMGLVDKPREPLFNSLKLSDNPERQRENPQRHNLIEGTAIFSGPYGSESSGIIGVSNGEDFFTFHGKPTFSKPYERKQGYWHWGVSWKDKEGNVNHGWISTPNLEGTVVGEHDNSKIVNFYPADALKYDQFK
jgi:hypothetical protein